MGPQSCAKPRWAVRRHLFWLARRRGEGQARFPTAFGERLTRSTLSPDLPVVPLRVASMGTTMVGRIALGSSIPSWGWRLDRSRERRWGPRRRERRAQQSTTCRAACRPRFDSRIGRSRWSAVVAQRVEALFDEVAHAGGDVVEQCGGSARGVNESLLTPSPAPGRVRPATAAIAPGRGPRRPGARPCPRRAGPWRGARRGGSGRRCWGGR